MRTFLVLIVLGCSSLALADTPPPTAYDTIGGKKVVAAFVHRVITRVPANKLLKPHWVRANAAKIENLLNDAVCAALDGPCSTPALKIAMNDFDPDALMEVNAIALDAVAAVKMSEANSDLLYDRISARYANAPTYEVLAAYLFDPAALATPAAASLYDRLGGKDAIKAVVNEFILNVAADPKINKRFAKTDIKKLQGNLVDQICAATGGPCKYAGKSMKDAHKGMQITEDEFNALVGDLKKALDAKKVGDAEQKELFGLLGGMKSDVVGK